MRAFWCLVYMTSDSSRKAAFLEVSCFRLIVVAFLVAVAVAAPAPAPGYVVASPVHYVPSHHVVHHAPIVKTVVHHTPIVKYKTIPVYKAVPVVHSVPVVKTVVASPVLVHSHHGHHHYHH
nr:uncharacterized protein LOC115257074 isoform X1 [Aedes albopictus]